MIAVALLLAAAAPQAWQASASDGVVARTEGQQLSYDFGRVSGYAVLARAQPVVWPANYEVTLRVRGTGGVNELQVKFVDASGENVWWVRRPVFRPAAGWQTLRLRPADIEFAWGPTTDKTLRRTARIEVVVVRGRDGGAGTLEIEGPVVRNLPPPRPLPPPRASDPVVLDGDRATAWTARAGTPLVIDFGGSRALGGLTLRWMPGAFAAHYAIEASDDRRHWRPLRAVTSGDGGDDPIALPKVETRYLRVVVPQGQAAARLAEVQVEAPGWAATPNAFVESLAKAARRGNFPRGFSGEQPYWTLVGTDGGSDSGLIGEDGAIEVARGGFSIEPFVIADGRVFSWADVSATPSLMDGYLPMPHVGWNGPGWTLDTSLFADIGSPRLMARWRLTNTGTVARRLRLALAVRPFQVNPPAQFLGQPGGVSPIRRIRWQDGRLDVTAPPAIDGDPEVTRTLFPLVTPTTVGTRSFDQGALGTPAAPGDASALDDPTGLGSATITYDLMLAPGETADIPMAVPLNGPVTAIDRVGFDRAEVATAAWWRTRLGGVTLTVPPARQAVADTLKTAVAHILMSRAGPALKPGTRSYDRSWIRDGAMMSDTLLRVGLPDPARAFADWYGAKLFANGKVPCCVDARGPDPVPENDAEGEYIHLVTQLYRYTGDRAALLRDWPRLDAARRYMDTQRLSQRTPANLVADRRMLYGLMPPSISHEGYSAKPQYSLWDDFWALTGYKDAAFAAGVLGRPEAPAISAARDQFAGDVHAAIDAAVRHWKIDFVPGATSLGDWDATSTTVALDPAGEQGTLDPRLLAATFERQWRRVRERGTAGADWADYTPYEWRNVSAFVRLGWRARAEDLLDSYMADRRPAAWNGWAEVVGRRPREVRFIGDMPHAWVASDFVRAVLDLFAYERTGDDAIVVGAGLTDAWLRGAGSALSGLRTRYGTLDLRARMTGDRLVLDIGGTAEPAGGIVVPAPAQARSVTVNGVAVESRAEVVRVGALRVAVRVERQAGPEPR